MNVNVCVWKEAVVACFKELYPVFAWKKEGKELNNSVRPADCDSGLRQSE
jgi:hypothetical protein